MYKTVVNQNRYYDKTIQLHKNYREVLNIPILFKASVGSAIIVIGSAVLLGVLVSIHFWWLMCLLMLIGFITAGCVDINDADFWPERKAKSEDLVGATKGVQYRVLEQLHNTMEYEEVDNFSNRQDIAGDVFNILKVHRVDKSLADDGELIRVEQKLIDIEKEAKRQRKEIKMAGLHAETPSLDLAADIARKTEL